GSVLFKHTKDLGRGHLGAVDMVEPAGQQSHFPGKVYACKTLTIGHRQRGAAMVNELVRLESARTLCHPHLPTVVMTYEEDVGFHTLRYGIVMNPVAKYTLSSFLESSSNNDSTMRPLLGHVKKWIGCLSSALSYVHAKDILHRRIKPSSILVENGEIFFTEFAISNHFKDTHMLIKNDSDPNVGVDIYKAPEVEMQQSFGPKADIFSLACVYIEMLATVSGTPLVELGE
ncbi:kinase-like domain-containing protein, partial [Dendryphion nanum]